MKFLYKWLVATVAGAVTMFVWGGISHIVLLEGVGFSRISNEERIVSALRSPCPATVCISFRASTSEEIHPQKKRPPLKQGSVLVPLE
jgi:hypothetical protein